MVSLKQIEDVLAQTQCKECGYDGCTPYAEALLKDETAINRCRPGGNRTIKQLSVLLNKPVIRPALAQEKPQTASVQEKNCIGCTLCIQACPTNCIIGAPRMLHSVYMNDCTGCKLCVDVCPEDCIDILVHPIFSHVTELPEAEKEAWEENRKNEVRKLVTKSDNIKHKKLRPKKPDSSQKKNPISAEKMELIMQARKKSKEKYSALKLPNRVK
jgi:electron transport complex protein RnfB